MAAQPDRALTMRVLYEQDSWQDELDRAARIDPRSEREREHAGHDNAVGQSAAA